MGSVHAGNPARGKPDGPDLLRASQRLPPRVTAFGPRGPRRR